MTQNGGYACCSSLIIAIASVRGGLRRTLCGIICSLAAQAGNADPSRSVVYSLTMNQAKTLLSLSLAAVLLSGTGTMRSVQDSLAQPLATAPLAIPLKPDPPPAVDGDLGEWASLPNALKLNRPEQVVYGRSKWTSLADLNATVWLAWRNEYLFLAADVTDDRFRQTQRGDNMWKDDHIELYLDATPDAEPQRTPFGKGQFHFGFSPGNFQRVGDPLFDLNPEAVVFRPTGMVAQGVLVAAKRAEKGYTLEAAVPWALVNVKVAVGVPLGIEAGVSDSDSDEAAQESLMTILTDTWAHTRSRLAPAVLSPADGKAPPIARGLEVVRQLEVKAGEKQELRFDASRVPPGREAVLALKARLVFDKPAGYTPAMRLLLNGKSLDASRLVNKKPTEERADGVMKSMAAGDVFFVDYAPDFDSPDTHPNYALKRAKACAFDLKVTDLLSEGANTLVIENAIGHGLTNALVVAEGRLEFRAPVQPPKKRGPPTGPLPVFEPASSFKVNYTVKQQPNSSLLITVGGETFLVESQFSTPEPKWQQGSNSYFALKREVEKRDESLLVRDTFTNLTDANLPIMQRHRATLVVTHPANRSAVKEGTPLRSAPDHEPKWQKVWLAGLSPSSLVGTTSSPDNPATFGVTGKAGIGLMPLDDVFQVHVTNFSDGNALGLADNNFALTPKATHTAEWAIVFVVRSGSRHDSAEAASVAANDNAPYFAFVNAARRLRGVNFAIDGGFAFLRADPRLTGKWTHDQTKDFVRYKNAKFLCSGIDWPYYKGYYAHGTAFQTLDQSYRKEHLARLRRLAPEAKHLVYFHCFIDVLDDAEKKYADARLLKSDGTQADYGESWYKIFLPTATNSYGPAITKNVDIILDDLRCDGVYWDELEYSAYQYHYGEPWDGAVGSVGSADIDPKTMKITRLKTSVTLLTQPWRVSLARRILARGPLIGNGQPHTRTMAALHFPRFVETGSISNCARAHLYTPIALGDHLTERSEVDAYRDMVRALDYGCVYYWYDDVHVGIPTHPHLTQFMFPITPLELGEGFIIGKERILTNRSGLFGWGDKSGHEVHIFDDEGQEVAQSDRRRYAKAVARKGKAFTELRIAEGWSAAIVRRGE